jgi:hypothetical protein
MQSSPSQMVPGPDELTASIVRFLGETGPRPFIPRKAATSFWWTEETCALDPPSDARCRELGGVRQSGLHDLLRITTS